MSARSAHTSCEKCGPNCQSNRKKPRQRAIFSNIRINRSLTRVVEQRREQLPRSPERPALLSAAVPDAALPPPSMASYLPPSLAVACIHGNRESIYSKVPGRAFDVQATARGAGLANWKIKTYNCGMTARKSAAIRKSKTGSAHRAPAGYGVERNARTHYVSLQGLTPIHNSIHATCPLGRQPCE